ncbi:hypothetical protein IVB45_17785 [Bradyrhizobium sp. 4]|uniref:hypothetical protein n=1 Tax=unclassified Bradyrhizobium TaxID=2631580 RepID=UPI001FF98AF2|nr:MULTISPECIES: hypothetical protein [unclassified Bradyrhizobium]MCK1401972.1 hypothetical protein [Bradyrhizobium sp. 39]MCK1751308.1 hypothetical protein [Bradyrhizobium sp. 135]UPJ38557.1 hypothetical protein IVB45_17785 [Bradyrhizobium sp. 4]
MSERSTIVDLIRAMKGTLMGNLNNFWTRSAEDLVAGGVPRSEVAESLFTVGLTYKLAAEGKDATVRHLHTLADFIEDNATDAAGKPAGRPS